MFAHMEWAVIDGIVALPLAWGLWRGFRKGLIVEVASLVALISGLYAGFHGSDRVATALKAQFDWSDQVVAISAFILAFVAVVAGIHFLAKLLEKTVQAASLGGVNKVLGALFSVAKWALLLSIFIYILDQTLGRDVWMPDGAEQDAILFPVVEGAAAVFIPDMDPDQGSLQETLDGAVDRVKQGIDEVKEAVKQD
jgi:membrane protein required for colicin V production